MKTEQCAKFKIDNRAILAEKAKTNAISRNASRSSFLDSSVELSNEAYALNKSNSKNEHQQPIIKMSFENLTARSFSKGMQ